MYPIFHPVGKEQSVIKRFINGHVVTDEIILFRIKFTLLLGCLFVCLFFFLQTVQDSRPISTFFPFFWFLEGDSKVSMETESFINEDFCVLNVPIF